ncbi:hypothetical protein V3C99_011115 [Haemonchus contortus]
MKQDLRRHLSRKHQGKHVWFENVIISISATVAPRRRGNNCVCGGTTVGKIIPNAPIPEFIAKTPYELGRVITIAMQTHVPDVVKRDLLVDDDFYVTLSPTDLAVAYTRLFPCVVYAPQSGDSSSAAGIEGKPPTSSCA